MASGKKFICEFCGKGYRHNQGLFKHRKDTGHRVQTPEVPKCFVCNVCGNAYAIRSSFRRHCKTSSHSIEHGKIECIEDNCDATCHSLPSLVNHLKEHHGLEFREGVQSFSSEMDFQEWKSQIENEEECNFVNTRGSRIFSGAAYEYYRCHKSGKKRNVKSKKVGHLCTAFMKVKRTDCITVTYNLTHYRHENAFCEMRIPTAEKERIAEELRSGVSTSAILDRIRSTGTGKVEKIHLITKSDIRNIRRAYGIRETTEKTPEADDM